jgi:hypothetical protein
MPRLPRISAETLASIIRLRVFIFPSHSSSLDVGTLCGRDRVGKHRPDFLRPDCLSVDHGMFAALVTRHGLQD